AHRGPRGTARTDPARGSCATATKPNGPWDESYSKISAARNTSKKSRPAGVANDSIAHDPGLFSARSLDQEVGAGTAVENILSRPANQDVIAGAAEQGVVARTPDQDVVAVPAVLGQLDRPGRKVQGLHQVAAGQRMDEQAVDGGLGAGDVHLSGQAGDRHAFGVTGQSHNVVPVGAVDIDGVCLAVARAAPGRAREIEVHVGDPGADQAGDGEGVRAAPGSHVDLLDAVDVHGHVAEVADQTQPVAV